MSSRSASSGDGRRLGRRGLTELLETHGLRPSRALGQNFLADPNTAERIVALAGVRPGDRVVEVGPGLGSLTTALISAGALVTAVELDGRLAAILRDEVLGADVAAGRLEVVQADALDFGWVGGLDGQGWALVANLPYNVATPLVIQVLERVPAVERMLVMVQREVAERLAAPPGSRTYGAASVKVAYWAEAEVVGRVPPAVFLPRPRVESALVRIVRRPVPAVGPEVVGYERLAEVVRAGFGRRRKMLRGSLAGVVDEAAFAEAGVDPTARAEDLGVVAWGRLAGAGRASS